MSFEKVLGCLIMLVAIGCSSEPSHKSLGSSREYSFYVAGHTYGAPGVDNIGVHPPFKEKFDMLNADERIDFGFFTGDIVHAGTEQNWNEVDSDVDLLDHPVYFVPGNHDMTDRVLYEKRYGRTYSSFIHESDLFILLDPNLDSWNISGDQLAFLKKELQEQAMEVKNIFVFFHQVLYWMPDNEFKNVAINSLEGRSNEINFWNEIAPLFTSLSNNVTMFAGDVGAFPNGSEFLYHKKDNIIFIASGMGGGAQDNVVICDIGKDKKLSFRLISLNGENVNALGKLEEFILP